MNSECFIDILHFSFLTVHFSRSLAHPVTPSPPHLPPLRTGKSMSVAFRSAKAVPFRHLRRSFAERKATLLPSPVLTLEDRDTVARHLEDQAGHRRGELVGDRRVGPRPGGLVLSLEEFVADGRVPAGPGVAPGLPLARTA